MQRVYFINDDIDDYHHETYRNLPISGKDLEEYAKTNKEILDNNWGVAIDILPESMFSKIKNLFK